MANISNKIRMIMTSLIIVLYYYNSGVIEVYMHIIFFLTKHT